MKAAENYPTNVWIGEKDPPERVLSAPSRHSLQECFGELKCGRPAKQQRLLERLSKILDHPEGEEILLSVLCVNRLIGPYHEQKEAEPNRTSEPHDSA